MRRMITVLALLVAALITQSAHAAGPYVCVPSDPTSLNQAGTPFDQAKDHIAAKDCAGFGLLDPSQSLTGIRFTNTIVVYFTDPKPLSDLGFQSVRVTIGTDTHDYLLSQGQGGDGSWHLFRLTLAEKDFPSASHGALVQIQVVATGVPAAIWYLRLVQRVSLYGVANTQIGLWFPVALFSTNFKSNSEGVSFAPMPIGLAFGAHWNLGTSFYIGGSVIASWMIAPEKDSTGAATGNYSAANITPGALLDFNGYFYAGYAYGLDLTSAHAHAKSLLVVGIAPQSLQFLQGR